MLLFVICTVLYFLPSMQGFTAKKQNRWAIFFLNLILGWTVVVWLVCFIWAFVDKKAE